MGQVNELPLSYVEWEGLKRDISINRDSNVSIMSEKLPAGISNIKLYRDYDYSIKGLIKGDFSDKNELNLFRDIGSAGSIVEHFGFKLVDKNFNIEYEFKDCDIPNSLDDDKIKYLDEENSFELHFSIDNLKRLFHHDSDLVWHIEWFLNGPRYNIFNKYNKKEIRKDYLLSKDKIFIKKEFIDSGYFTVKVTYNDKTFNIIVYSIPHQIEPSWSGKIGIAYSIDDDFPIFGEREAISEILGFIFGRELINVGYTKFDEYEKIGEDFVRSPPVRQPLDIRKICDAPDSPPINEKRGIKKILTEFTPRYLEFRNELKLNYLLYRYWTAQLLIVEVGIPIFGAALEDLTKRWIKSKESKFIGEYVSKDIFEFELQEELCSIDEILQEINYNENIIKDPAGKIYDKISKAYEMSISDKIKNFFYDIDLNIDKIENKAINARHGFAHGSFIKSENEFEKQINNLEAYKTLINRILLKLLKFEGKYIDYYTIGFPERPIDEPIGFREKN